MHSCPSLGFSAWPLQSLLWSLLAYDFFFGPRWPSFSSSFLLHLLSQWVWLVLAASECPLEQSALWLSSFFWVMRKHWLWIGEAGSLVPTPGLSACGRCEVPWWDHSRSGETDIPAFLSGCCHQPLKVCPCLLCLIDEEEGNLCLWTLRGVKFLLKLENYHCALVSICVLENVQ